MTAVSDSSPLIALTQIGEGGLLQRLFTEVVIPPAVQAEIAPSLPELPRWISVLSLTGSLHPQTLGGVLGRGEQETITLAIELGATRVILDDGPARRVANSLGLPVIGTLGILLAAKRRGLIKHLRPHLDALVNAGFFLGPALLESVLRQAGE